MKRTRLVLVVVLLALLSALVVVALRERWLEPSAPRTIALAPIDAGPRPGTSPSEGCGRAAPAAERTTVTVSGVARTFEVVVPASYDPARAYPLVLAFHGSGWQGKDLRHQLPLDEGHDRDALLLYPDAVVRRIWAEETATHWGKVEDLPFFDALVAWAKTNACVDLARVFVVGWSSGGYFANQLACVRADVVRAAVALSGGGPEDATCTRSVAVFIHHGRDDHSVMVSEGRKSRDFWRGQNACTHDAPAVDGCVRFEGCRAPLVYCESDGTGHSMPPSLRPAIWTFLSAF